MASPGSIGIDPDDDAKRNMEVELKAFLMEYYAGFARRLAAALKENHATG